MNCSNCGKKLREDARLCPGCGAPVEGGAPVQQVSAEAEAAAAAPVTKKKRMGLIIGSCAAVLVVIFAVVFLLLGGQDKNTTGTVEKENTASTEGKENTAGTEGKENTAGTEEKENTAGTEGKENITSTVGEENPYSNVQVGDRITLGTYEQDNDTSDGAEPISWEVLAVEDGRALIVSDYAIACRSFHDECGDITWEACTLRAWLNDEFYGEAFSKADREYILLSDVENNDNLVYGTEGGEDTEDYVFLLSLEEVRDYYDIDEAEFDADSYDIDAHDELMVPFSQSALEEYHRAYTEEYGHSEEEWQDVLDVLTEYHRNAAGEACLWWWLRSPGYAGNNAAGVGGEGAVYYGGYDVYNDYGCVRPALWINLES